MHGTSPSRSIKVKCISIHCNTLSHVFNPIYPTPPLGQDMTQGQFSHVFNLSHEFVDHKTFTEMISHHKVMTPPQRVSWIWHKTIWWWGSRNAGALGIAEYLLIAIVPWIFLARSDSTWFGPIYGSKYGSSRPEMRTELFEIELIICIKKGGVGIN